jgi:hypothetical protein
MILLMIVTAIIITSIFFIPINVFIEFNKKEEMDNLKIWVETFFGLITYKLHIPYLELKEILHGHILKLKANIEATGSPAMEIEKEKILSFEEIDVDNLIEQLQFIKDLIDQFEAIERVMDTFKDELHRLDELTLKNPILLRIVATLLLGLQGKCKKFIWRTCFGLKDPAITGVTTGILWSIKGGIYSFLKQSTKQIVKPDLEVRPDFNQVNKLKIEFKSIFTLRLGNVIIKGLRIIINRYKRRFSRICQTTRLKH